MSLTTNQTTYKIADFVAQSFVEKLTIILLFSRFFFLDVYGSVHRESVSIIVQEDAIMYS